MTDDIRANGLNGDRAPDAEQLLADWRQAVANEIAALEATNNAAPPDPDLEHAYKAAVEHVRRIAREVWSTPVSGPVALRLRAEIAQHCLWANYSGEGIRRFEAVLAGQEQDEGLAFGPFDEQAVAELVKAVLWTTATPAQPRPSAGDGVFKLFDFERFDELDKVLCDARQGITTLRTVLAGWEDRHGPQRAFREGDAELHASMEFCATGIEAILDRMEHWLEEFADPNAAAHGAQHPHA